MVPNNNVSKYDEIWRYCSFNTVAHNQGWHKRDMSFSMQNVCWRSSAPSSGCSVLKWSKPPAAEAAVTKGCCYRTTVFLLVTIKWFILWLLLCSVFGFLLLPLHPLCHSVCWSGWERSCAIVGSQACLSTTAGFFQAKARFEHTEHKWAHCCALLLI